MPNQSWNVLDAMLQRRAYGVETLAGFLLVKLGHIPIEGEQVEFNGRRFEIVKMADQRIAQVRVDPIVEPAAEKHEISEEMKR